MSGFTYTFSGGTIDFRVVVPGERFEVLFNGEVQYILGNGTVFIKRLTAKNLGIPEWDNSQEQFDTNSLRLT